MSEELIISTAYHSAMFTHSDPAMANVFMPGDGDGVSERMVGRTVSKEACMERVKQLEPGANGATYLEHPDFDGGVSHQACYAEYGMTSIESSRLPFALYQSTFFVSIGCEDCPAGTISIADGEPCGDCDAGKAPNVQREVDGNTLTAVASCQACAAGTYAQDDDDHCIVCPAGKYQDEMGATVCLECECGQYQPDTAQTVCNVCGVGQAANDWERQTPCDDCGPGKYQPTSGACACIDCETGYYQPDSRQSLCIECSPGQYGQNSCGEDSCYYRGDGECDDLNGWCTPGTDCVDCGNCCDANGGESTMSCVDCPVGRWSSESAATGVTACIRCVAGRYLSVPGSTASSNCIECDAGKYSQEPGISTASQCISCTAGKATASTGNPAPSDCVSCTMGRYAPSDGLTDCIDCLPGQNQPTEEQNHCLDCDTGQYQSAPGGGSCIPCETGQSQETGGQTSCIACPAGQYEDGQRGCLDCEEGRYTADNGQAGGCTFCAKGYYQDLRGQTDCKLCEAGQYAGDSDMSVCAVCENGEKPSLDTMGGRSLCINCNDFHHESGMLTAADYHKVYNRETDECECADSNAAGGASGAYYDQRASWAAATSSKIPEWPQHSAPLGGDMGGPGGNTSAAPRAAEFVLPWQVYARDGGWTENGWEAVDIAIDRSAVARWYHDHDTSDHLKEQDEGRGAILHNTYLLQCLVDGQQALQSRAAFASVIANTIKLPDEAGVASCVDCASARECVTCCNEQIFCPRDGSYCIPLLEAQGRADGQWQFPANCSANDTQIGVAVPKAGWWRSSIDSPRLHRCPVMDACKGGHDTPCATELGYRADGITCATCRNGYMRSSDGRCLQCPPTWVSACVLGASLLFVVLVSCFLIQKNARSCHLPTVDEVMAAGVTSAEKITSAFRIMMAFIQLTRLSTSFVLPWPLPVVETAEVASVVTDPGVATRAVPCFFSSSAGHDNGMPFSMTRFILIALSPVLCTLIPTAYYSVAKLQASRNDEIALKGDDTHSSYTDRTVAAVVCLIFVIYPTVVKSTFSMFTCVDLEAGYCSVAPAEHLTAAKCEKAGGMWSAGLSVLRSDAGVQCFEGDHGRYVWFLSIPSIVLWVIGIPLVAALTMKYYHDLPMQEDGESQLYSLRVQRKFAFLYKSYEPPFYYWERESSDCLSSDAVPAL